jgi:hypothetical protein
MQNKRGQELSTTAIILIILGVLVLVILIVGFSLGWNRIAPWLSRDNVNQVVDACNTACTTKSVYDVCLRERDMTAEKVDYKGLTCNYIANYMERDTTKNFGITPCADLVCTSVEVLNRVIKPTTMTQTKIESFCTTGCNGASCAGKYIQAYYEAEKTLASHSCTA